MWVDDDDENKIIYFVFFVFLVKTQPAPDKKTCPAATVHVLKQKNIKINYQKQTYPFLHTSIILLLYYFMELIILFCPRYVRA